jgi:CHASE2 domain-containing sensor protein
VVRWRRRLGLAIVVGATIAGMVAGNLLSTGAWHLPFLPPATAANGTNAAAVGLGLLPVMLVLALGLALL